MKRTNDVECGAGEYAKRFCPLEKSLSSSSEESNSSDNSSFLDSFITDLMNRSEKEFYEKSEKEFYEGENGIIQLKEKVIAVVDKTPRVIHKYALAAFKKPGVYFAQSKTDLFGPFFMTPTPNDLPKGELLMIYECFSSRFSETSTSCFLPVGLFQN